MAAVLVVLRRRTGLVLAAAILITDAAANAYAVHVLGMGGPAAMAGPAVVTVLAAATLAVLPSLWPRPEGADRPRASDLL